MSYCVTMSLLGNWAWPKNSYSWQMKHGVVRLNFYASCSSAVKRASWVCFDHLELDSRTHPVLANVNAHCFLFRVWRSLLRSWRGKKSREAANAPSSTDGDSSVPAYAMPSKRPNNGGTVRSRGQTSDQTSLPMAQLQHLTQR